MLVVAAAAVLLSACGGISRDELTEEARARGGGLGETLPLEAIDAVEEELGEPVVLRSLSLSLNSVTLQVLVPGTDDQTDTYTYSSGGSLRGPEPVTGVPEADQLRRELIDPDRIVLDDLDDLVDEAIAEAGVDGGWAESVYVSRTSPDLVTISVTVMNERESATVTFRGNGQRLEAAS